MDNLLPRPPAVADAARQLVLDAPAERDLVEPLLGMSRMGNNVGSGRRPHVDRNGGIRFLDPRRGDRVIIDVTVVGSEILE